MDTDGKGAASNKQGKQEKQKCAFERVRACSYDGDTAKKVRPIVRKSNQV